MFNNEERKEKRAEKKHSKLKSKFWKQVDKINAGENYSLRKFKKYVDKLDGKDVSRDTPSGFKSRTYTKGANSESRALARAYRKDKREANKPQSTKTEGVPFEPPRMLTSEEVWSKPTLGGMKRQYLNSPRKELRAAAAAGRAFRKGKMS